MGAYIQTLGIRTTIFAFLLALIFTLNKMNIKDMYSETGVKETKEKLFDKIKKLKNKDSTD